MLQFEPRNPTFRAAEWDIGTLTLTKPCDCEIRLLWRQSLERHDVGYCPFSGMSQEYLNIEINKVLDEGEFNQRFYRKRHAKQARQSWLCVLELTDRLEREQGVGPYHPAALELMNNLAKEQRAENPSVAVSQDGVCDACGMEGYFPSGVCPGCNDGLRAIEQRRRDEMEFIALAKNAYVLPPIKKDNSGSAYYTIALEDRDGHKSREEMLVEIGAARNPVKKTTQ